MTKMGPAYKDNDLDATWQLVESTIN